MKMDIVVAKIQRSKSIVFSNISILSPILFFGFLTKYTREAALARLPKQQSAELAAGYPNLREFQKCWSVVFCSVMIV